MLNSPESNDVTLRCEKAVGGGPPTAHLGLFGQLIAMRLTLDSSALGSVISRTP
jgi:hypothetical protein